jgi:hypothetical protein
MNPGLGLNADDFAHLGLLPVIAAQVPRIGDARFEAELARRREHFCGTEVTAARSL